MTNNIYEFQTDMIVRCLEYSHNFKFSKFTKFSVFALASYFDQKSKSTGLRS